MFVVGSLVYLRFYWLAGTPTAAGYLTQGSSAKVALQPPPVDKEDTALKPDGL